MPGSTSYHVHVLVEGELAPDWSATFAGLAVRPQPDGTTLVSGELIDQAALHGLLSSIRDLGLTLVSVETSASSPPASRTGG